MRNGPSFFGNLKNLVFASQGAKQSAWAAGPETISGPAAMAAELSMTNALAATMPPTSDLIIDNPPDCSSDLSVQFLCDFALPAGASRLTQSRLPDAEDLRDPTPYRLLRLGKRYHIIHNKQA